MMECLLSLLPFVSVPMVIFLALGITALYLWDVDRE